MIRKNVCFITLGNLYLCPYLSKYTVNIDGNYDVIYWNRHVITENSDAHHVFSFDYKMDNTSTKIQKLIGYIKFRKYVISILKDKKYDGIILLQSSIGFLLADILVRKWCGRYLVDIRDYTMEHNPLYYLIISNVIKKSGLSVISSSGYLSFLPDHSYTIAHNDVLIDTRAIERFHNQTYKNEKIVISFIGLIRFNKQNEKNILRFKNDERFVLNFIGKDANHLEDFCEKNSISNVKLIDRFPPEKTLDYYYETQIVYNLYGNNTPLLDYALSNKLYYAARLRKPIIVCPNTFMAEIVVKYGLGYVFNVDDQLCTDGLFEYYNSIDWSEFDKNCKIFINDVETENSQFVNNFRVFLSTL